MLLRRLNVLSCLAFVFVDNLTVTVTFLMRLLQ